MGAAEGHRGKVQVKRLGLGCSTNTSEGSPGLRKSTHSKFSAGSLRAPSTKHGVVAQTLWSEIQSGQWSIGDQIPSEQEIAKRFNVASMTARQAVGLLVAQGTLQRIPRKGTFVASFNPVQECVQEAKFVLLLEGGKMSLDPFYLPPIIEAFEREIGKAGHRVTISGYSEEGLARQFSKEAIVCCVLMSEEDVLYANLLRERGNRVLAINRCNSIDPPTFVAPDNAGGAQEAVEHLISLGHRKIGFVRGKPGNIDGNDRRFGYLQALLKHSLNPGPEEGDNFIEACGHEATAKMLAGGDPPTAIFCASDLSAIGAMKAVAEAGFAVPRDVSIVGFGDFPLAKFLHPGLTTVHLPLAELGASAAQQVLKIDSGEPAEPVILRCTLVRRETTGPANR
jgi:DNA-binding LacI/PurR family transcriptional regulator